MVKNPKPFYDSIEERLEAKINKAMKLAYERGCRDGYQKALEEQRKTNGNTSSTT